MDHRRRCDVGRAPGRRRRVSAHRGRTRAPRARVALALALVALLVLTSLAERADAEPYIAVMNGLKCATCHVNPSGGGKRTLYGMTYARTQLAARNVLRDESAPGWASNVNKWFGIGGDLRGGYRETNVPGPNDGSEFSVTKGTVYAEVRAVQNWLTLYVDEQVAPDNALNREAYLLVTPQRGKYTVKLGQFFLPFGLRLQDDSAFVRQRSGINFDTPDDGLELGVELPRWSAQAAFTNGTAGAGHRDDKRQASLSASYVRPRWRVGASLNRNEDPLGDRTMQGLFAGWRTGPISWLTELDFIRDDIPNGGARDIYATLLEGNWRVAKGQNLKVTYEFLDPSDAASEDEQERYSAVWEYGPTQLSQVRLGYRSYNGVPSLPVTNRSELFLELHVYF